MSEKDIDKYLTNVLTGEGTIERDIPELAKKYADIQNRNYKERQSTIHFPENEVVTGTNGQIGEWCFLDVLTELQIPSIHNSLTLTSPQVYSDFWVPGVGFIDVKTISPGKDLLIVTVERWRKHPADFVVVVQLLSTERFQIVGYLSRSCLEVLPTQAFPSGECYYTPTSELSPWSELLKILLQAPRPNEAPDISSRT